MNRKELKSYLRTSYNPLFIKAFTNTFPAVLDHAQIVVYRLALWILSYNSRARLKYPQQEGSITATFNRVVWPTGGFMISSQITLSAGIKLLVTPAAFSLCFSSSTIKQFKVYKSKVSRTTKQARLVTDKPSQLVRSSEVRQSKNYDAYVDEWERRSAMILFRQYNSRHH